MDAPNFSIVTPSFRSSSWLKLCIASVADQEGVTWEHIVQDSCSDDGTQDWLPSDSRVQAFIEKDSGMYDAVNRGWKKCKGEILAYLNCDEQYLPGALKSVKAYFDANPDVDLAFGHVVVVNADGAYLMHRKLMTPSLYHSMCCHLATLTCAMFVRRSAVVKHELYFDPQYRDVGDGVWVLNTMKKKLRTGIVDAFTSVFTDTGANMSVGANALRERALTHSAVPAWIRFLRPLWIVLHRLRKLVKGIYFQKPFSYFIYTRKNPENRTEFKVTRPTAKWRLGSEPAC